MVWLGLNTVTLPVGSTQSNMAEVCSPPLQAMLTAPTLEMQRAFVIIKQFVTRCSQTQFKFSVAGTLKRARTIHVPTLCVFRLYVDICYQMLSVIM